jgi:hypothetical protein
MGNVLFAARFSEELDEYETEYTCYLLPKEIELSGSWEHLEEQAHQVLGKVPVAVVRFDASRRRALDWSSTRIEIPR